MWSWSSSSSSSSPSSLSSLTAHCYQRHSLDIDQDYVRKPEEEEPGKQKRRKEAAWGWGWAMQDKEKEISTCVTSSIAISNRIRVRRRRTRWDSISSIPITHPRSRYIHDLASKQNAFKWTHPSICLSLCQSVHLSIHPPSPFMLSVHYTCNFTERSHSLSNSTSFDLQKRFFGN